MISIVFLGTSSFALPALESLLNDSRFRILGVITQKAKPTGRKQAITPSPIEERAKKLSVPIWSPEKIGDITDELGKLSPDCLVVASYGQIIPKNILDIPRLGAFNIHPSLLPKYRGPSPVPAALLSGETETGVTIMLMDEKMDHGPILRQEKLSIEPDATAPDLLLQAAGLGAKILPSTIIDFNAGKLLPQPQNHKLATFSKIFTREDGKINFKQSATEIFNQYRALWPWPGFYAEMKDGKKIKFIKLARSTKTSTTDPGTLLVDDGELLLQTARGVLQVLELQLAGGKPLETKIFLNGYQKKLPLQLF